MQEYASPFKDSSFDKIMFDEIMTDISIYEDLDIDYIYYDKLGILVLDDKILEINNERYEMPLEHWEAEAVASRITKKSALKNNLINALQENTDWKLAKFNQ